MTVDQDYVCGDYGTETQWTQIRVTVPLHELDELTVAIDSLQQALAEGHGIIPAMMFLRHKVDALEAITDDNVWPLPKYREMLFIC